MIFVEHLSPVSLDDLRDSVVQGRTIPTRVPETQMFLASTGRTHGFDGQGHALLFLNRSVVRVISPGCPALTNLVLGRQPGQIRDKLVKGLKGGQLMDFTQ